jgi:hypothetical protein
MRYRDSLVVGHLYARSGEIGMIISRFGVLSAEMKGKAATGFWMLMILSDCAMIGYLDETQ